MIDYYEQQVTASIPLLRDNQEQNFLSLENIPLLWPDIEAHKQVWKAFRQEIVQVSDTYADVSIRRAFYYEEQACERYRSACQYYQRKLYCGAAMWLGKTIFSMGHAIRRWGYTAIWLRHLCSIEQMPSSSRDTIYRMLIEASRQQYRLCTTLHSLQRTYFAYCFDYALIPSLFEEDREEKRQ